MGVAASLVPIDVLVESLQGLPEPAFNELEQVRNLLRDRPVDPASLERYLFWDSQHYTRNLIDKTPLYELLAICWEVGHVSSIHNHRNQNCWMAVPLGQLQVQNYRVLAQDLQAGTCNVVKSNLVVMDREHPCAVNPREPVHRVQNPREWRQRAVSLHVYSRPFDTCDVYSEEQQSCGTIGLSYTSVRGSLVSPA
jgi:cysteine dioxygenase